jgi:hypothetical protein
MRRPERNCGIPAKIKLMAGGKVVGGTVLGTADPGHLLRHGQWRL